MFKSNGKQILKDFKTRYPVACFGENRIAIRFLTPSMPFANSVQVCLRFIPVMRFVLFSTVVTISRAACYVVSGLQRISSYCRARPERKTAESNFT